MYEGHLVIAQEQGGLYAGLIKKLTFDGGRASLTPEPLFMFNPMKRTWTCVKEISNWFDERPCVLHQHSHWKNFLAWSIAHVGTIFIFCGNDPVQGFAEMDLPLCEKLTIQSTS
ncbi:MAG: hypothetical protein A3J55_01985 [Candidatus Ryanbacteria bacterium RIFCSPHIGHO2_02_FULL_45_17b]|uniref:Uncharacterized protein n=1 Tax=Candidatus Ryanbacteria bacterium RIFCSPHIGHO2_01_FULL_45_22 TaxID=1802114 RepID=A0A1G2FZI5_9BACT|nr:MAG: hypothetical protein A2719_00430 [Candidatus Ryanbacteria bacterium RIFCSPHIGHO2_01_FULL_45_22]OGZ46710.1 MAG: hypothetical protein A3J55_01985 [Candidatus Ryanbacteria bacterium RIFCSPHIGHO2_02_FULL_45_17b]